jgi:hypothetical protein
MYSRHARRLNCPGWRGFIVRESMPASEAATRVGIVILASVFVRRLGVRRDLRCHRFLRCGVPERAGVECDQRHDHPGAIAPGAVAMDDGVRPSHRRLAYSKTQPVTLTLLFPRTQRPHVNAKTARAARLDVPVAILLRVDSVTE